MSERAENLRRRTVEVVRSVASDAALAESLEDRWTPEQVADRLLRGVVEELGEERLRRCVATVGSNMGGSVVGDMADAITTLLEAATGSPTVSPDPTDDPQTDRKP